VKLKADALDAHLAKQFSPLYVVTGDEALLALEAADAIRANAKQRGFTERRVFQGTATFDWSQLAASASAMSLFGDKPFIDLRIPTGKPGKSGAEALVKFARSLDADSATLITLPKLERASANSSWFTALAEAGTLVQTEAIDRAQLPSWIGARLKRQKQSASRETLEFIAAKVEGNLLAAHQEIQKLSLLCPPGELPHETVVDAVLNVARYDVFKLSEAWLAADVPRFRRMIEGLKGEGEAAPLVLWALTEDVRTLSRLKRGERVWKGPQSAAYEAKARRTELAKIGDALKHAAAIDRLIKGLRPRNLSDDLWEEFFKLGTRLM
jgi:DNA polymerase III subunit delta